MCIVIFYYYFVCVSFLATVSRESRTMRSGVSVHCSVAASLMAPSQCGISYGSFSVVRKLTELGYGHSYCTAVVLRHLLWLLLNGAEVDRTWLWTLLLHCCSVAASLMAPSRWCGS